MGEEPMLLLQLRHGGGNLIPTVENTLGLGAVAENGGGQGCCKNNDAGFHNNQQGYALFLPSRRFLKKLLELLLLWLSLNRVDYFIYGPRDERRRRIQATYLI